MSHHTSKLGILIIVIILGIVGVLIVTKTRSERMALDTSTSIPVSSSPEEFISDDENIASSSNLSSPIPKPPAIEEYVYPNASSLESTNDSLKFNTSDSAQEVTDWYKNKISALNFNAKSFTQTSANGVTFNKITAARPGENIDVTIKKDQTTSNVQVTVDRS